MKSRDYRNTDYCPEFSDIQDRKAKLNEVITIEHPKVKIIYNQIKNKKGEYNKTFLDIYNHKCGYCGASQKILSADLYEVDHFVCSSLYAGDNEQAGRIQNLIVSCRRCNRKKKDFLISGKYKCILNPDDGSISKVFFRDEGYYIRISKEYLNDDLIKAFYNKLELGSQVRRLDYLLMSMDGLNDKIRGTEEGRILAQCIVDLLKKRNNY